MNRTAYLFTTLIAASLAGGCIYQDKGEEPPPVNVNATIKPQPKPPDINVQVEPPDNPPPQTNVDVNVHPEDGK